MVNVAAGYSYIDLASVYIDSVWTFYDMVISNDVMYSTGYPQSFVVYISPKKNLWVCDTSVCPIIF